MLFLFFGAAPRRLLLALEDLAGLLPTAARFSLDEVLTALRRELVLAFRDEGGVGRETRVEDLVDGRRPPPPRRRRLRF